MKNNSEEPILLTVNPVIPVDNIESAIKFYCERLGFRNVYDSNKYEKGPTNYIVLCRKNICIHFQLFESLTNITMPLLKFPVKNIEVLYKEFKKNGAISEGRNIYKTAWSTKEFAFYDPFMTGLTFYENLIK